jgi:hypothetical protein
VLKVRIKVYICGEKVQAKAHTLSSREIEVHVQLLINLLEFFAYSLAHLPD